MKDEPKSKQDPVEELKTLRRKVAKLEKRETGRKRAEEELRLKNLVFDASIAANSIADLDGVITEANDAFLRIWGYPSKEEVIGKPLSNFINDSNEAAAIVTALNGTGQWDGRYTAKKKDGSTFIAHGLATVVKDANGKMIGYQSAVIDVTEHKRAEEELRKHRDHLEELVKERTAELEKTNQDLEREIAERRKTAEILRLQSEIVGNMSEGVYLIRLSDGLIVYANPKFEAMFGYDPGELMGREVSIVNAPTPERGPEETKNTIMDVLEKTGEWHGEVNNIKKDGTTFWCYANVSVFDHPEHGKVLVSVHQDITERKRAEEEIREKSEQLQRLANEFEIIIDSIPGLVFYKDLHNNYLRVNKYVADGYQKTKKELEGVSVYDLHSREEAQAYLDDDLKVIKSGKPMLNYDEGWPTETGFRWVSTSKIPYFDEKGEAIGIIGVSMDITERKRAEEELERSNGELEAANRELSAFSYSVSHDLRAPLRAIQGFSNILLEDYAEKLDSEARRHLNTIRSEVGRMGNLIDDILSLSRLSRQEMKSMSINMADLAQAVFRDVEKANPGRRLELKMEGLPPALGDRNLIRQVLVNLFSNAVKFSSPREIGRLEIGGEQDQNEFAYYVKDNGVGFDMKYVDKLFGVFQRLHSSEEFEGTGIGLAIVKRIIGRHGGRVWAEGKLNEGATFYFTLGSA